MDFERMADHGMDDAYPLAEHMVSPEPKGFKPKEESTVLFNRNPKSEDNRRILMNCPYVPAPPRAMIDDSCQSAASRLAL